MAKPITSIYIPVSADYKQFQSDMGQVKRIVTESASSIASQLNGALSGDQAKRGINSLVSSLSTLSQSSKNVGKDFSQLGVDLKQFQSITGTSASQFAKLQSQLLQTQAAKAQEKALRDIARQAGLTQKEVQALGKQFGLSQAQITNVAGATAKTGSAFSGLLGYITPAIAGMMAFQKIISAVSQEFKYGLSAVEDFGMSIAQSTALITTFSQRAKSGDVAGAYRDANAYAKELILSLEMIDQKSIANAKDLRAMSETFIANGVLLQTQNQQQVDGFIAVANALAIMTQGQNREVQMRQEIRGLMDGEIRSQDKLGMLLKAQIPDIEKQLVKWRDQGVVLEKLGELLQGFNAVTGLLENQWATVGATMENIHDKVLRGMFEPVFNDLIKLAKEFNKSMMDAEGNLTPLARGIIKMFQDGYEGAKSFFDANDKGWTQMIARATLYGQIIGLSSDAFGMAKDFISDYGKTGAESATQSVEELEQRINEFHSRGDDWWEFQLFKDPEADKKHLDELTAKLNAMGDAVNRARESDPLTELTRVGGAPRVYAPKLAPGAKGGGASAASDMNAAMQAQVEALKAGEERKLAEIKAANEIEAQENQNAYDLGLKSYSEYLNQRNSLTEDSLQSTLNARKKELAAAEQALASLKPITDKEGNARPDKDSKARADAEKKVENAKRSVIEAEKELQKAEAEGTQQALLGAQERKQAYTDIQVQLLESQGRTVEAAQLMAQYDEESLERKRLIAEVDAGIAGAQEALDAKRLISAQRIRDAELETLERQNEARLSLAEMDGEYYKSLDIQTQLLDLKIQNAEQNGALAEEVMLLRRQREELERMKNPLTAFVKGWQDVVKHQRKASEQMYDLATETARDLQETFSDTFFDVMKGDFEDIGDLWEDLLGRMLDNFLRTIADMVAAWAATEIFEITFSASGGGGSSGSGIASTVASTAVSAVAEQYLGTSISEYIMSEVVYPAIAEVGAAITGATSASAAAATSTSLASGTATPAILDAAATYGTTTAAAGTSTAATSGASGVGAGSGIGVSAGTATTVGMIAYAAAIAAIGMGMKESPWETPFHKVRPEEFDGSGLTDQMREVTDSTNKTIGALVGLGHAQMDIQNASLDTANGIIVASRAMTGKDGLVEAMDYSLWTWNEQTGQWWRGVAGNKNAWDDMIGQMQSMAPATNEAVVATAQYVAQLNGLPSAADELVLAFTQLTSGIDATGTAFIDAAGNITSAEAALSGGMQRPSWMKQDEWDEAQNAMTTEEMYQAGWWSDSKTAVGGKGVSATIAQLEEVNAQFTQLNGTFDLLSTGVTGTALTMAGEGGLIPALQQQNDIINQLSQSSGIQNNVFSAMVAEMRRMNPATESAIQSTAQYIAEMYGVPAIANDLASAFALLMGGMSGLGSVAIGTAGSISEALTRLNSAPAASRDNYLINPDEHGIDMPVHEWATGGDHPGGWAMVGERGRELIYTPPSRVYNAADTNSILAGLQQSKQQGAPERVTVEIHGKGGIEALIDKVIVKRGRQGVPPTRRAYIS